MADDIAAPRELGESRGVLNKAIRRDLRFARLAAIPWPHTAPARLALHFYLLSTGRTLDEANSRAYGPMDVDASAQFRDDYNSVMLPLHAQVQAVAKQYVASVKRRLSLLHFKLNLEGMPERLSEAAQRIGRQAGGLSLEIDQARAQVERANAKEKAPVLATPPRVPHFGIPFSPEDRKKANEEAAEFRKFYTHVRELARARIGPLVRRDPLLATLFEHPEDESLNVPLGGLSILQAYADSAKADGGASRASAPILGWPPSDKRQPHTTEGPASHARSSPTLQSYLPATSRESHRGTALANALIRHAMGGLDEFAAELSAKGNEDHALRYLPFVLGGIEKAGLAKVLGFRQFAVWDCERVARSTEELLDAAGMAIAYVGMFFPVPIGAVGAGTAAFAVETARAFFVYAHEHERQLAATAGVFLGQTQQWAKPTDYSEATFAALSAAAALAMASVAYLEAPSEFAKIFRVTPGRADTGRAAKELAEFEASKAASAANPRMTDHPMTRAPRPVSEEVQAMEDQINELHSHPDAPEFQRDLETIRMWVGRSREPEARDLLKKLRKQVDVAHDSLEQGALRGEEAHLASDPPLTEAEEPHKPPLDERLLNRFPEERRPTPRAQFPRRSEALRQEVKGAAEKFVARRFPRARLSRVVENRKANAASAAEYARLSAVDPQFAGRGYQLEIEWRGERFQPDAISETPEGFRLYDNKEVLTDPAQSAYRNPEVQRELRSRMEKYASIARSAEREGCLGWTFTTNDETLADLMSGFITDIRRGPEGADLARFLTVEGPRGRVSPR